jgi:peptide deformylase
MAVRQHVLMDEGGTVRRITRYGEPVLHQRCEEVTVFDEELAILVSDMFATMRSVQGVGLAANQVGISKRVFVIDCPISEDERLVAHVINPVLELPVSRSLDVDLEGCLSVPGPYAEVGRPDHAKVTGVDLHGEPVMHQGGGFFARCLQHEYDHLEGVVYVDRLGKKDRKKVLAEMEPEG